jgi:16S rRNA (guanine(966)-N(2))-methyltransferase RsmD
MSGLRIIAGKARGRKLRPVPGDLTRPITDRTKESLFNIIGADIQGASFLDLFAGTGSVGIEALSRGAAHVYLIDKQHHAIETIRYNLQSTGLGSTTTGQQVEVLHADAFMFLGQPPSTKFEYIYIAPPQYKGLWIQTINTIDSSPGWLSDDAWVIVQIHPREYEAIKLSNLTEFDQRKYGSTLLIFYSASLGTSKT